MAENNIGLAPQIQRVVASPTDIYSRTNAGQSLGQLAEGLSQFAPSLSRFADVKGEQQAATDKQAGENAAEIAAQSGKTYAQAIKEGIISPHQSPWFRVGAYETFGRVSARSYHDAFDLALRKSVVSQSTNPQDFDAFERQFRTQWTKENIGDNPDPYLQNAFGKQTDNLIEGQREQFVSAAGKRLLSNTTEAAHGELFGIVTDAKKNGMSDEQTIADIQLAQARYKAIGLDMGTVNRLTASAIAQAAKVYGDTGDASILKLMEKVPTEGKNKLIGASYAGDAVVEARNEISKQTQEAYAREEKATEKREKDAENSIISEMNDRLLQDPHADTRDLEAQMNKVPGGAAKVETMLNMKDSIVNHEYMDNGDVVATTLVGIHSKQPGQAGYVTQDKVNDLLAAKLITAKTYTEFSKDIKDRDDSGTSKLFNDEGLKLAKVRNRTNFHAEFGFENQETDWRLAKADRDVTSEYLKWRKGPGENATPDEVNRKASEIADHQYEQWASPTDTSKKTAEVKDPVKPQGPTPADPKKMLTHPAGDIEALRTRFNAHQGQAMNYLTERDIKILQDNNVPPNPKSIKDFLEKQMPLIGKSAVPHL